MVSSRSHTSTRVGERFADVAVDMFSASEKSVSEKKKSSDRLVEEQMEEKVGWHIYGRRNVGQRVAPQPSLEELSTEFCFSWVTSRTLRAWRWLRNISEPHPQHTDTLRSHPTGPVSS